MTRLSITSTANDRLKNVRRLHRRRDRGAFLVERARPLRHALDGGAPVREVYAAPELFLGREDGRLVALAERRGATVYELSAAAFSSISRSVRPDGLAAIVERWRPALGALRLPARPLVVVAEAIERPGNLGTLVRTACAADAAAFVVCDGRTDLFQPDTVRSSVGTLFRVQIAQAGTPAALAWLRKHGIRVVVATPDGERPYWKTQYRGATAVVFGSERYGVSQAWLHAADETAAIPMSGAADSVNVGVAAGVFLFEAARQRLT